MSEGQLNNPNYAGRPSMCRSCGALVGVNETSCSLCGAPKASSATPQIQNPPPHVQDSEAIRFARAVLNRPYIFTIIFLVANIFIFMLMSSSGGSENYETLVSYGAKLNSLIDAGEWWRFVTPIFIHIGPIHLLVNMYGLWIIGPYVEKLYGSAKFVVLWVVTGIAGLVASYFSLQPAMQGSALGRFLFRSVDGPAAGASGALFGLIGVLFVFGIKFRRELPEGFKRAFGTGLLPVILINLFIGYIGRSFIDNAAHLGGLVAGAVFALVIGYKRPGERASVAIFWHILQIAALALVAVSFTMVVLRYNGPAPSLRNINVSSVVSGGTDKITGYLNAINGGQNALVTALSTEDASGLDSAIKQLDEAEPPDEASAALRGELSALLARARDSLSKRPAAGRAKQRAELQRLNEDFSAWVERSNQWVKTEGGKYGIVHQSPPAEAPKEK